MFPDASGTLVVATPVVIRVLAWVLWPVNLITDMIGTGAAVVVK